MKKIQLRAEGLGLVVPINIEALCVGKQNKPIFQPSPYDFSLLPDGNKSGAFLGETVRTTGLVNLEQGVHLHWALPDGLTKGVNLQGSTRGIQFPAVPDRWLVTRVYTGPTDSSTPVNKVKSWIIESNYLSEEMPDYTRPSVAVPVPPDSKTGKQYRYLGRVLELETWVQQSLKQNSSEKNAYVSGLNAVGYGTTEFSASYQNCRSIFGFCDKADEIVNLITVDPDKRDAHDFTLSYSVIGWYDNLASDPLTQLPLQMYPDDYDNLLSNITDPDDKEIVEKFYKILQTDGTRVLDTDVPDEDRLNLIGIFSSADYDFAGAVLTHYNWSLPSGTSAKSVTHTLLSGQITEVRFNRKTSSIETINPNIDIAIGNTAYEALAALIASKTGNENLPNVELLLNALQLGELGGIKDGADLSVLERVQLAMHASTFQSTSGGYLWQITPLPDKAHEVKLENDLVNNLNELNLRQQQFDKLALEIISTREQIFMDWYRLMLALHGLYTLDPQSTQRIGVLIRKKIENMKSQGNTLDSIKLSINELLNGLKEKTADRYTLECVSAPRFWKPCEPVILFQGDQITPPQRYGGDGRFMADNSLLCRLSNQLVSGLTIPANALGKHENFIFNSNSAYMPKLGNALPLTYSEQIHGLFLEFCLLSPRVISTLCKSNGATWEFDKVMNAIASARNEFIQPLTPSYLEEKDFDRMKGILSGDDYHFLASQYEYDEKDQKYVLLKTLDTSVELRLTYIFISAAQGKQSEIHFSGIAPSKVYFVTWGPENPWLPLSLSWKVDYFPYEPLTEGGRYDEKFILNNFKLGDVSLEPGKQIGLENVQQYSNFIFMSPHAAENFQIQIEKFIRTHQGDAVNPELQQILDSMKDFPPVLSQSLNGLNAAMLMRDEAMQLEVHDPSAIGFYATLTDQVREIVGDMNQTAPSPGRYYNPIRAGAMQVSFITIADVFGRNFELQPDKVIVANSLRSKYASNISSHLTPRIVQPSRLQFRWQAANNNAIEMNSHPATTPVCGWLMANYLDRSLWIYNSDCKALGSLTLTEDERTVMWQGVPGESEYVTKINDYFNDNGPGGAANSELKKLVLALYNKSDGAYLKAFMHANDITFSMVQPQNYKQMGSTAVLMGSPVAVAQVRIELELAGLPARSQSWQTLIDEATGNSDTDKGFMKVQFPVRLGAMEQVNDGLLGYFTQGNYDHFYSLDTDNPTDRVSIPNDDNLVLTLEPAKNSQTITVLFDPRGSIHATCGILPVKEISLPPEMYADNLRKLEMTFLATPVITNGSRLAFPVPAEGSGKWSWIENELKQWSPPIDIAPVDDRANLQPTPQVIKEGWLKLTIGKTT